MRMSVSLACLRRSGGGGSRFWFTLPLGRPDHDTDLFREKLGEIPLGGFFCNGEIGPVGGATFLHGYTSAFALFREESPARG